MSSEVINLVDDAEDHSEELPTAIISNAALSEIQQILKCGLCLEPLNRPQCLQCGHLFCQQCLHDHFTYTLDTFKVNNPEFDETTGLHIAPQIRGKLDDPITPRSLRRFLIRRAKHTSKDMPQPKYLCPSGCGKLQTRTPIPVYALAEAMHIIAPAGTNSSTSAQANFARFFDVQYIDPNVIWL
ncbi:hypothetical protein LXA43DRAFT_1036366 [Ganoderma leucocontextum]|nr:hypothetical protein LXA43DRAFT_1036366 [Ganoderma leucocontextum]